MADQSIHHTRKVNLVIDQADLKHSIKDLIILNVLSLILNTVNILTTQNHLNLNLSLLVTLSVSKSHALLSPSLCQSLSFSLSLRVVSQKTEQWGLCSSSSTTPSGPH